MTQSNLKRRTTLSARNMVRGLTDPNVASALVLQPDKLVPARALQTSIGAINHLQTQSDSIGRSAAGSQYRQVATLRPEVAASSMRVDRANRVRSRGAHDNSVGRNFHMRLLLLAAFAWRVLPGATDSLLGNKPTVTNEFGQDYVRSDLASSVRLVAFVSLVAVLAKIFLTYGNRLPSKNLLGLVLALVPGLVVLENRIFFETAGVGSTLFYFVVALAIWTLRPTISSLSILAWIAGLTASLSLLTALIIPEASLMSGRGDSTLTVDKGLGVSTILAGPFGNGNALGVLLACAIPTLLLVEKRNRIALAIPIVIALLWSQSRAGLIGVGVSMVALAIIRWLPSTVRPLFSACASFSVAVVAAAVPLYFTGTDALTYRGYVWALAFSQWAKSPLIGSGMNWFSKTDRSAILLAGTPSQGHNLWVHTLATGGLVYFGATLLVVTFGILRASRWTRHGQFVPFVFLVTVMVISITEVPLGFGDRWFIFPHVTAPLLVIVLGRSRLVSESSPDRPFQHAFS